MIAGVVQHDGDGEIVKFLVSCRSNSTTDWELMYPVLVKVTTSLIMACTAPNTLSRFLPKGVGTKMRVRHQR